MSAYFQQGYTVGPKGHSQFPEISLYLLSKLFYNITTCNGPNLKMSSFEKCICEMLISCN